MTTEKKKTFEEKMKDIFKFLSTGVIPDGLSDNELRNFKRKTQLFVIQEGKFTDKKEKLASKSNLRK